MGYGRGWVFNNFAITYKAREKYNYSLLIHVPTNWSWETHKKQKKPVPGQFQRHSESGELEVMWHCHSVVPSKKISVR